MQTSWQQVGQIKTFSRVWGEGKPILVIHGWGQGGQAWEKTAPILADQGFQVILPDLPGFGKTAPPCRAWNLADYSDFLTAYLDRRQLNQAVLIGHSFGGQLAVFFTVNHPKRVGKLILIAPAIFRSKSPRVKLIGRLAGWWRPVKGLFFPAKEPWLWRRLVSRLTGSTDYAKARGAMRETLTNILKVDVSGLLAGLTCPTLLIWGKRDRQVAVKLAVRGVALKPDLDLMIFDEAGHDLPFSQPEKLVEAVVKMVGKIE